MKCHCPKTQLELTAYTREDELPVDLLRSVSECPECRAFWQQTRRVAALIALKRYEQPDELALERCRVAVRRSIRSIQEEADTFSWESIWGTTMPAFRFSVAALFMALLGLHVLSASRLPAIHTTESSLSDHVRASRVQVEQIAQDERPNPEFSIMMLSNWAPRVQQAGQYQFIGLGR